MVDPIGWIRQQILPLGGQQKRFRVIIDYDPEWSMKVTFRRMTQAEAELMKAYRPTKDELDKIQERIASRHRV